MAPRAGEGPGSSTGPEGPLDGSAEAYARFQEGSRLLDSGNSHAAVVALERARDLEPDKGSIREALARAYFRSKRVEAAKAEFDELIATLQRTLGLTVFMVTHDLDSLYSICDRIAALADGKVVAAGPISTMLASSHPWVRAYFHGKRARLAGSL